MTKVDASDAQQGQQAVHIVLIGLGVIGVADVGSPLGRSAELAAEVVFQGGANDLRLAIVEIFRADEPDDAVDQQRPEDTGHGIGPDLKGLLIDAVVRLGRQGRAPWPVLKYMTLSPRLWRPSDSVASCASLQQSQIDAEALIGALRPRDRLEGEIDGRPLPDQFEAVGDMGEDAGLGRNGETLAQPRPSTPARRAQIHADTVRRRD